MPTLIDRGHAHAHPHLCGHYPFDMYVMEYALRQAFWAVGALLFGWWVALIILAPKTRLNGAGAEPRTNSMDVPQPFLSQWVIPHITSRSRRATLIFACIILGLLQLVEGYWVAVTGCRLNATFFALWPTWSTNPIWFQLVYSLMTALLLCCTVGALAFVGVMFSFQIAFTNEVALITLCEVRQVPSRKNNCAGNKREDDERRVPYVS